MIFTVSLLETSQSILRQKVLTYLLYIAGTNGSDHVVPSDIPGNMKAVTIYYETIFKYLNMME